MLLAFPFFFSAVTHVRWRLPEQILVSCPWLTSNAKPFDTLALTLMFADFLMSLTFNVNASHRENGNRPFNTSLQSAQMRFVPLCVMNFMFSKSLALPSCLLWKNQYGSAPPTLAICFLSGQSIHCSTVSCGLVRALHLNLHTHATKATASFNLRSAKLRLH